MEPSFTIRRMKKSDIRECVEIFIQGSMETFNEHWSKKDAKEYLSKSLKHCKTRFCATLRGEVVGFAIACQLRWYDGIRYSLKEIFVEENQRGKRIGTALYEAVENEARKHRASAVELITSKDSRAFKFYNRKGFVHDNLIYIEKKLKR